jgi:hypothetical protein
MTERQMSMLLTAVTMALADGDNKRACEIMYTALTLLHGAENERQAARGRLADMVDGWLDTDRGG